MGMVLGFALFIGVMGGALASILLIITAVILTQKAARTRAHAWQTFTLVALLSLPVLALAVYFYPYDTGTPGSNYNILFRYFFITGFAYASIPGAAAMLACLATFCRNGGTGHPRPKNGWIFGALAATAVAATAALVFAAWWFATAGAACGVVRFYEYLFGVLLIGGWLTGTTVGLLVAFSARRRNARTLMIAGCLLAILVNCGFIGAVAKIAHAHLAANFALKNTSRLLELLASNDLDARNLAAHELGERRAREAIPPLCDLLTDADQDINVRHNAAIALGNICAASLRQDSNTDLAVNALIVTLQDRDEYLPSNVAKALENIGDSRAIAPLAGLLDDSSRSSNNRAAAARALGKIGGTEALAALKNSQEHCADEEVRDSIARSFKAR